MKETRLRIECMRLAMQAALQYGAFSSDKLTQPQDEDEQEDFGEHWPAIVGLADAIFKWCDNNPEFWHEPNNTEESSELNSGLSQKETNSD